MLHRRNRQSASRHGAVLVLLLLVVAVILGLLAVNMDGGRMMDERGRLQQVADSAALAAAGDMYLKFTDNQGLDPSESGAAAAAQMAKANGIACDGVSSSIIVNTPPTSGAFQGNSGYVEVILSNTIPGSFSAALTRDDLKIRVRSVARGRNVKIGILLLEGVSNNWSESGTPAMQVSNGSVLANSTAAAAVDITNGTLSANTVEIVGGKTAPKSSIKGKVHTGVKPTPDPLAKLTPPNKGAYSSQSCPGGSVTLNPGVYDGGINVSSGALNLLPGVYIMDGGGFGLSGDCSVTGDQVMIYSTGGARAGPIALTTTGAVRLTPPKSGTYAGISIFQDKALKQTVSLTCSGNLSITGSIYAPSAPMTIDGTGNNTVGSTMIAKSLGVSGTGTFNVQTNPSMPGSPDVHLAE